MTEFRKNWFSRKNLCIREHEERKAMWMCMILRVCAAPCHATSPSVPHKQLVPFPELSVLEEHSPGRQDVDKKRVPEARAGAVPWHASARSSYPFSHSPCSRLSLLPSVFLALSGANSFFLMCDREGICASRQGAASNHVSRRTQGSWQGWNSCCCWWRTGNVLRAWEWRNINQKTQKTKSYVSSGEHEDWNYSEINSFCNSAFCLP